jgi:hypothetical protein
VKVKKNLTLDEAIVRLQKHILKKYPNLKFLDVVKDSERSATIWFEADEDDDWFAVIERAGPLATDILVDTNHWIHVLPRIRQPAS